MDILKMVDLEDSNLKGKTIKDIKGYFGQIVFTFDDDTTLDIWIGLKEFPCDTPYREILLAKVS